MAYNTVTVTTSATLIITANTQRLSLIIENTGTQDLYIGQDALVTTSNGILLEEGDILSEDASGTNQYKGPYYGIVGTSTSDVRYWERIA